jgi:hypothetical protein
MIIATLMVTLACEVDKDGNVINDDTSTLTGQVKKQGGGNHQRVTDDYYLWDIGHFFGLRNETIEQEDCKKWMTLWKEEKLFWAINMPNEAMVFIDSSNPAQMKLFSFELGNDGIISQISLHKTTAHQTWISQNLPQTAGTHWTVLTGDSATASTCREGSTAAGKWKAQINYLLDFGGGQDDGLNSQTSEYYCYQGEEAPFFFPENSMAQAFFKLQATQQDEPITCVGPMDTNVAEDGGDWHVASTPIWYYDKPSPIQARYHIYKPAETYTIDWQIDSNIGTGWKLVFGNETGPYDPEQIVSNPFPATLTDFYVWAVADMPANTADGSYATTVTFTVTNPENVDHATYVERSLMWVGDWTPPGGTKSQIYMPLLLR